MSNVLITHSYFYPLDAKQWRFKQPYPPLGTLLATSVIRETGLQVSIVDSGLQKSPHYIFPALKEHHPTYFIIYDDGFNYLTKMCLTVMRDAAFEMINEAKKHGSTIIINSSDATDHYEKYLSLGADYIIRGEGEETLKELLLALENKQSISPIQGLAFKEKENIILTPPRAVLRNLDSLPLPAWDLIDLEPYKKIWLKHHRYFSLNIATTRGCRTNAIGALNQFMAIATTHALLKMLLKKLNC